MHLEDIIIENPRPNTHRSMYTFHSMVHSGEAMLPHHLLYRHTTMMDTALFVASANRGANKKVLQGQPCHDLLKGANWEFHWALLAWMLYGGLPTMRSSMLGYTQVNAACTVGTHG